MHDHDHDHILSPSENSPFAAREAAIRALLIEKGILTADELRRRVEAMDARTPAIGAHIIARAWVDPDFKKHLLQDAETAIRDMGIPTAATSRIVAVENTDAVHNLIVCTLCSCYPIAILGRPPAWYKSLTYRSRAVADPRGVLREFGLELSADTEVRVHDSTADIRYLVIPQRPPNTEDLSEAQLTALITRDSMIGVAKAQPPKGA